tara:strand:+ start:173 stop:691 length:519 start_codon:yes stop_codon:yes gene_type:complete
VIIELFKIPVLISNIDLNKINLKSKQFKKTWVSETPSTHDEKSDIDDESVEYITQTIGSILEEQIKHPFQIYLKEIWENNYVNNDHQEPHLHIDCDFSFIIYKDVKESKTVFINPLRNYLQFYKNINYMYDSFFKPKCKTGQIIVFPSFLQHMVLKSSKQKTISGNVVFKKL